MAVQDGRSFGCLSIFTMVSCFVLSFLLLHALLAADALAVEGHRHNTPKKKPPKLDTAWHAPNASKTNDLDWVINAEGTDGKWYDGSHMPGAPGQYNYCNMPRVKKYTYPGAPADGMKLEYVEVIHRHHKRAPYEANMFETKEGKGVWDCSDPADKNSKKECSKFPQITRGGLEDSTAHGKDLFATYSEKLQFIPKKYDKKVMTYRVTNNPITTQICRAVLRGMYPDAKVDLQKGGEEDDSLEPRYNCLYADNVRKAYQGDTKEWKTHLERTQPLFDEIDKISSVAKDDEGFHSWWDHYFDFTTTHTCHGLHLPCNKNGECISKEQFDKITRLGQWEYSYIFRDAPKSLEYATYHYGVFPNEVLGRMRKRVEQLQKDKRKKKSKRHGDHGEFADGVRYTHNVAHDGSVSSLLGFLQVDSMVWTGMGAEIVFEMWSQEKEEMKKGRYAKRHGDHEHEEGEGEKEYSVRILWGGRILISKSKTLGWAGKIPLKEFGKYIEGLTGKDAQKVWKKCNAVKGKS